MMECKLDEMSKLLLRPAGDLRLVGADGEAEKETPPKGKGSSSKSEPEDPDEMDEDDLRKEVVASRKKITNFESAKARFDTKHEELKTAKAAVDEELATLKKDGITDTEVAGRLSTAESTVAANEQTIKDLRIQVAFLSEDTVAFKSKKAALKLLETGDLEIDKDGSVHGMAEALEKLVEENPFLVADKDDDGAGSGGDGKGERRQQEPPVKTGENPSGKQSKADVQLQAREEDIRKRFKLGR